MVTAIVLSRALGKPMGTVYPDGQVIYSTSDAIAMTDTLLLQASGNDEKYHLQKVIDDISPGYSDIQRNIGECIEQLELSR